MLRTRLMKRVSILFLLGILLVTACAPSAPEVSPTPTLRVDEIQTFAVATFSSALTATALVAPTDTPVPTLTPIPTLGTLTTGAVGTPFVGLSTPGAVAGAGASTASCYGLTFVSDVTIPDNTQMDPGETFTKTWKVQNSGSCAWDAGFKFQSSGGNVMGATAFSLPSSVAAGATYDISVPMTAPGTAGTARGNWRMSTASGQFFGDEVFVQIVVGGAAAGATNTSAPPADVTATPTQ